MENYKINIVVDCVVDIKPIILEKLNHPNIRIVDYSKIHLNSTIIKEITTIEDINAVKRLKKNNPTIQIICIVDNGNIMFETLSLQPLQFIRKQELSLDLEKTISLIYDKLRGLETMYTFKSGDSIIRLNINNILYIESYLHYVTIYTGNGQFLVREKLSVLIHKLSNLGFIQTHKSYVINKKYIVKTTTSAIILSNEIELPIGRKYKESIKNSV